MGSLNEATNACQKIASQAIDIDRSERIPNGEKPVYRNWITALRVCEQDIRSVQDAALDIKHWDYKGLFPNIYDKEMLLSKEDGDFYNRASEYYRELEDVEGADIKSYY